MDVANFIFRLLHIFNLPSLAILTPLHTPYTPSIDYAHLSTNCVNSYVDYIDFSIDCGNKSDDYVNMPNDWANIIIDSTNNFDILSSNIRIPNPSFL
jgi:hypothetical protein